MLIAVWDRVVEGEKGRVLLSDFTKCFVHCSRSVGDYFLCVLSCLSPLFAGD